MARRKLILGNWKLHFTVKQAVSYAAKLAAKNTPEGVEVAIAPSSIALSEISSKIKKTNIKLAAQNAYFQDEGAFTGEISMPMIHGIASYVLIGHSERRGLFGETLEDTKLKMAAAVRSGITPVLCIGETLLEKSKKMTKHVLHEQLTVGVADLTSEEVAKIVIAYEPVWAISSGQDFAKHKAAAPEDANEAQSQIRDIIESLYGEKAAEKIRILYGGSSSADNAVAFLAVEGIDGLLPGGASLSMHTFWPMVEIAGKLTPKKINITERAKSVRKR